MERKEFDRAAEVYQAALSFTNRPTEILYLLGLAFREGGEPEKARAAFQEVLRLDPGHPGALRDVQSLSR